MLRAGGTCFTIYIFDAAFAVYWNFTQGNRA
jgi:hypothetical protein